MITIRTVTRPIAIALLAVAAAGVGVLAQQSLTPTPTAAPGYTNVVVTTPVRAAQEGAWTMKASQDGGWTMKVADLPLRTIAEQRAPAFISVQKMYVFSWSGGGSGNFFVTEVSTDGWVRARTSGDDGRGRTVWVNTRQIATVEER